MSAADTYTELAEQSTTATITELSRHGITDAYLMDPGPGTVHVPTPDGGAFLADLDGGVPGTHSPGYSVGYMFHDGSEEREVWSSASADLTEAVSRLARAVTDIRGR